jgi:hypothetical protein
MPQTYTGNTYVLEGTAQPPDNPNDNTNHTGDGFKCFGISDFDDATKLYVSKIIVSEGAVFDIRAEYAWRSKVVLDGGTFANTCRSMANTTWGGSGVGALTADSSLDIRFSTVFGDSNGKGDTNLGGYTLNATIAASQTLYLRSSYITNGVFAVSGEGTLGNTVTATDMSNATLELGCAINMGQKLSVKNYTALYTGNNNWNNAELSVTGTFKPIADRFYGPKMQDGSTMDFTEVESFPLANAFTGGNRTITFAADSVIYVNVRNSRAERGAIAKNTPYILEWGANKATREASASFILVDENGPVTDFVLEQDDVGLKIKYVGGMKISIR